MTGSVKEDNSEVDGKSQSCSVLCSCCIYELYPVNLIPSTGTSSEYTKKTKKSQYSSKSAKRRDRMKTDTLPKSSENDILLLHTSCNVFLVWWWALNGT